MNALRTMYREVAASVAAKKQDGSAKAALQDEAKFGGVPDAAVRRAKKNVGAVAARGLHNQADNQIVLTREMDVLEALKKTGCACDDKLREAVKRLGPTVESMLNIPDAVLTDFLKDEAGLVDNQIEKLLDVLSMKFLVTMELDIKLFLERTRKEHDDWSLEILKKVVGGETLKDALKHDKEVLTTKLLAERELTIGFVFGITLTLDAYYGNFWCVSSLRLTVAWCALILTPQEAPGQLRLRDQF